MIRRVASDGRIETGGPFTPILRRRLVERIGAAAAARITLIVAPAGYGKSVALRQYLDTLADAAIVRFDLHAEHGTLLGFVRGLSDALLEIVPDARKTLSGAYEHSRTSKSPGTELSAWMHAHLKTFSGIIAIDDLHLAEGDPEISRFLVSLIERTKGRVRWMLASRSSLDLPVGSWLAYGEMDLNIDEQDLRFTLDEARETAKASRVSVRDEELAQILEMTSGWPTALSFAIRSSTRSVDLRNIAANTREMVYRYLAEQVYRTLGSDERELLQFISFLPEVDLEVLGRAGYTRAKAVIETLRDRVAFIYPDRPGVYRCHDLFGEFLRHEAELLGEEAVRGTQMRAALALEECGRIAQAMPAYAAVHAQADLLRLLESDGFSLIEHAHADAVEAALHALPQKVRAEHPVVLGLRALQEQHAGHYDRAESLFRRAIEAATDSAMRAHLAVRLAAVLFNQGGAVVEFLQPLASDAGLPLDVEASIVSMLVMGYAYAGRRDEALAALDRAETFAPLVESDEVRARLLHRMGAAALQLGLDRDAVFAYFTRAQTLASACGLYVTAAAALSGLESAVLLYDDDFTRAAWLAQQGMNAAQKAGDRFSVQTALLQMINIELRRGNPERLASLEKQFAASSTTDLERLFYVVPGRAMLAAWDGRFDEAYRLLSTVTDRSHYSFDRILNIAIQALYALGAGKRERAVDLVASACSLLEGERFEFLHAARSAEVARAICAIVEAFAFRTTIAQRILSHQEVAEGPAVSAMRECAVLAIRFAKNPALGPDFAESLVGVRSAGYAGIALLLERLASASLREGDREGEGLLTKAEIGVLQALADGLSPKDIAAESGRSVYTIQAHIQNLIKKLGCSGRSEALTVARKKGIVKFN